MRRHHGYEVPVAFGAVGVAFVFAVVVGTMAAILPLLGVAGVCFVRAVAS